MAAAFLLSTIRFMSARIHAPASLERPILESVYLKTRVSSRPMLHGEPTTSRRTIGLWESYIIAWLLEATASCVSRHLVSLDVFVSIPWSVADCVLIGQSYLVRYSWTSFALMHDTYLQVELMNCWRSRLLIPGMLRTCQRAGPG